MSKNWPTLHNDGYDKHVLYEASVQSVEVDIELFDRVFKRANGCKAQTVREDFCGTALMATEWVKMGPNRQAWGIDLDAPTLEWAKLHRVSNLSKSEASRIHLLKENVLHARTPGMDVICALNFSYQIFRERETMKKYFTEVYNALNPGGFFFVDVFGGPQAQAVMTEKKKVKAGVDVAGHEYPKFKYTWDQSYFNAVDNHTICHIHFNVKDGPKMKKAFTYDWRLWSITELRDLLEEVGFIRPDGYFEGWDDETGDSDGVLRKRKRYEDMDAWVAYLAARKPE